MTQIISSLFVTMVFLLNGKDGPLKCRKQESVIVTTEHLRDQVFTEESTFEMVRLRRQIVRRPRVLLKRDLCLYIWSNVAKDNLKNNRVECGGFGKMVVRQACALNAEGYQQLLLNYLLPTWDHDCLLLQDNATPHKAPSLMDLLHNNGIMILNN